jgi:hypothetical protein
MRTLWEDARPDLGGLRYDAEGCRRDNGEYDYNRIAGTIRYQMPCGYIVNENKKERRQLSISGRYSEPTNKGADGTIESRTLEAVSVDYIPWLSLIQKKHSAMKARANGDYAPWIAYLRERECIFATDEMIKPVMSLTLSDGITKDGIGLKNRHVRLAAFDRQIGQKANDEKPHWWGVIRDVRFEELDNGNGSKSLGRAVESQLVYEGKLLSHAAAEKVIKDHGVNPSCVVCDSSDDTSEVYEFAFRNGFNCLKATGKDVFVHKDGTKRIFSDLKFLHKMMGRESRTGYELQAPGSEARLAAEAEEPFYCEYSSQGIIDRFNFFKENSLWKTPQDVSIAYRAHLASSYYDEKEKCWMYIGERFDLHVCE